MVDEKVKLKIQLSILIIGYIVISGGLGIAYLSIIPETWYISQSTGRISLPGLQGRGVWVENNVAYVADGELGIRIINATEIAHPIEIGDISVEESAECVVIHQNIAYIGCDTGLVLYNVSHPDQPDFLGNYSLSEDVSDLVLGDQGLVYLANIHNGLVILNCTVPSSPEWVGSFLDHQTRNDFFPNKLDVAKDVVYSTNLNFQMIPSYGIQMVNISLPSDPKLIGYCKLWGAGNLLDSVNSKGIVIQNNYIYLADFYSGLIILNIQNMPTITLENANTQNVLSMGITCYGNKLFLLDYQRRFHIFDISIPYDANLVGIIDVPYIPQDIFAKENNVYVVDNEGLSIFIIEPGRSGIYYEEVTDIWIILPSFLIASFCFGIGLIDLFFTRSGFLD